jgi:hypothetical protein
VSKAAFFKLINHAEVYVWGGVIKFKEYEENAKRDLKARGGILAQRGLYVRFTLSVSCGDSDRLKDSIKIYYNTRSYV